MDPQRIGMIGFSAGAGLAGWAAANFDKRAYEPVDGVDQISCRPDFAVVMYNGGGARYSKEKGKYELIPDTPIHKGGPPMFIVATSDDGDKPEIAMTMYLAAKQADIPAELHVYALGGHGFGLRRTNKPCSTWPERCVDWMRSLGLLPDRSGF